MEENTYRRVNPSIEIIALAAQAFQYYFAINSEQVVAVIVNLFVYLFLSAVLYPVLDYRYITKISDRIKKQLNENPKPEVKYLNLAASYMNGIKLLVILFMVITSMYTDAGNCALIMIPNILLLLAGILFLAFRSVLNVLKAFRYPDLSAAHIFKNIMIYNNKEDNRVVIDKAFGVGSTINLATRQGKIILIVLLLPPIILFTLILILNSMGKI